MSAPMRRLLLVCFCFFWLPLTKATQLIAPRTSWSFLKGTREASSPDRTSWRQLSFVPTGWLTGPAPFYYGDPFTPGTLITDMQNNYSTLFFRKSFSHPSPGRVIELHLDVMCDDGFIAWINGKEVARRLAPNEPVTFQSFATAASTPDPADWLTYRISDPQSLLLPGQNILAVQVFNVSLTSSDIAFDAQLLAVESEPGAPYLVNISPFPGPVTNLTEVTIQFNEPVLGVDPSDLLVNQLPATSMSGSERTYTFRFPQPPYGTVQFAWDPNHGIHDLENPPNYFERSGANNIFAFDLLDPVQPRVLATIPPPGVTIRTLHGLQLMFTKNIVGLDPSDLLINNQPATNLTGSGAGPYLFSFPEPSPGPVRVSFQPNHQIRDETDPAKPLVTSDWTYTLDPQYEHATVLITELLAANEVGLRDEDGSNEDWIELYNAGSITANLHGWSLSDNQDEPGKWTFPAVTLAPGARMIVFASGKDRTTTPRPHTNFKLSAAGEFLGLFSPDYPRHPVHLFHPAFPEQRNDISYGLDSSGKWGYFTTPSPGSANPLSTITNSVAPVHFSVHRGFFSQPFFLSLATATPGAEIRYTTNGSEPTLTTGTRYVTPIHVDRSSVYRAASFKTNHLSARTVTHTYLFNLPLNRRLLPALSLVTATNHLYGATGIMESNPRNTTKHGIAWERPISLELIRPENNEGFQIDCGLRVAGGDYIRGRYEYRTTELPRSKYSYRVYFRGDYGSGKLNYPFFPGIPLTSFDAITLRAGMNDHSNPFIKDEFVRALHAEMGHVAAHGTFVNLFLNGVYKGYYNPTERIDDKFLRAWHGGTNDWDLIGANNQPVEGDTVAWNSLKNLVINNNPTNPAVYLQIEQKMDIENFIDYLLPQIWADNDDWPHNNTRAARERTPNSRFRFYVWDTEFSFTGHSVSWNTIANQLSSTSPPWGTTDYQRMFNSLRRSPEFRLHFADRVHKYFFNDGVLTDPHISRVYERIRQQVVGTIPNFNNIIGSSWIPSRRRFVTNHFASAGFLASSNAPVLNQFGGRVPRNFRLQIAAPLGTVYYTTNGADPRTRFTSQISPEAIRLDQNELIISSSLHLRARTLHGAEWSALTEASFNVEQLGIPLRFTEIMYNPPGGDPYEFLEIMNIGGGPVHLGGMTLEGVSFRFIEDTPPLSPGARLVLASGANRNAFALRYPNLPVAGYFDGSLSNGGELLALKDRFGNIIIAVAYDDEDGWPLSADGAGYSLEIIDPYGDPSAPANWQASFNLNGSPGRENSSRLLNSPVRLNEVLADNRGAVLNGTTAPDFVELYNNSDAPVQLDGWSLTDNSNPRRFVFPASTTIPARGYLVVWMDNALSQPGLHSGFGLNAEHETIFLFDHETNRVDAISYGQQLPDFSLARNQAGDWGLAEPTPGQPNNEWMMTASPSAVVLNELLADSLPGQSDWLELFNTDPNNPANLGGMYIALNDAFSRIPANTFIPAGGYLQLLADADPRPGHLTFKLPAAGSTILLYDAAGLELSRHTYGPQKENVASGRLPNGFGPWIEFFGSASPGAANYLPSSDAPLISEVLAWSRPSTDPSTRFDWIELFNPLNSPVDLTGISISLRSGRPGTWVFPPGTQMPPQSYLLIAADDSMPASADQRFGFNLGTALNNNKGGVYLYNPNGQLIHSVVYGFQIPNTSIGSASFGWTLLATPTPGVSNSPPAQLSDSFQIKFNEWMAQPLAGDDWFELYNASDLPTSLGGLYLTDDPSMSGRTNTMIAHLSFIAPKGFVVFQADEEINKGPDHVNFRLNSLGETLRLYSSTGILLDELNYLVQSPGVSEGRFPDGESQIVQFPGAATPGGPNGFLGIDNDQDGIPDNWERQYGLNPNDPTDALIDTDADGLTNLQEFQAGTNPTDLSSSLALHVEHDSVGRILRLTFSGQPNRSYTILTRSSLASGNWEKLQDIESDSAVRQVNVFDRTNTGQQTRYYRIITPRLP